jgi:hypothetical protein
MAPGRRRLSRRSVKHSIWSVVLAREELARLGELNFTRRYESGWKNIDHSIALGTGAAAGGSPEFVPETARRSAA